MKTRTASLTRRGVDAKGFSTKKSSGFFPAPCLSRESPGRRAATPAERQLITLDSATFRPGPMVEVTAMRSI